MENKNITNVETIAVVGLGYVGLPLAMTFVSKGYHVIGIDMNSEKINNLRNGTSYLSSLSEEKLRSVLSTGRLVVSDDYDFIKAANAIVICVPTPLTADHIPDLSYLLGAGEEIRRRIVKSQLVILESSTFPGTTREVLLPLLERSHLKVGRDIYLGYSPERVDPGNSNYSIEQIPKVVSGITDECANAVYQLYSRVFEKVVLVSSTEAAEFTKLLENTYRFVNISMINELAEVCDAMNLNIWEIISAAKTKPFGYSAFYPGPGIGGHCIPVDPLYLQWKAEQFGIKSSFIQLSEKTNGRMPSYIVQRIRHILQLKDQELRAANVLLYGVAYKRNMNDARESPAIEIMKLLLNEGVKVSYHDPFVPRIQMVRDELYSVKLTDETLSNADCIVILTDHSGIPIQKIIDHGKLVFDTRNVTQDWKGEANIYRLGGGSS